MPLNTTRYQEGEPTMNEYLKTITKAQTLIKQLLDDPAYGKITLGDFTISKPEDLSTNLRIGSLITLGVSEWFLTTNERKLIWQNYTQGDTLDNEGMYLHMLKSIDNGATVNLLHEGA